MTFGLDFAELCPNAETRVRFFAITSAPPHPFLSFRGGRVPLRMPTREWSW